MNKKQYYLAFSLTIVLILLCNSPAKALDVSGSIGVDTTWVLAESPYMVTGNIYIPEGVTLTIEPNVLVKLGAGINFSVYGTLTADTVIFTWADGTNEWDGIMFHGSEANDSHLNNCTLEHAQGVSSSYDDVIHLYSSSPSITGCTIQNS
ncbi:MAG: hypothetical protein DRH93_16350, partial [Deltaproteobacteria bacterium]